MQNGIFKGDKVQAESPNVEKSLRQGLVEGVETKKEDFQNSSKEVEIFNSQYQSVRKDNVVDLKLVSAHASVVIDADSGNILHYDKGRERRQIASLTKIMTAVLVLEKIKNLDEEVLIDEEAVYAEGTRIGCPRSGHCISQRLKVGEKISVRSLLQAMLMNSANDAAIALGKHISGSQDAFAGLMNQRANELGLVDTNFCTPSGLEPEGKELECYSSAYDIARVAAYSMRFETIWKMFRLPNNSIIYSSDGKISHTILNTDLAIDEIPNLLGGKTGFTPLAGYSLLMGATDKSGKHSVFAVLLDDPTRWQDMKTALNWTFSSYKWE
ncbi:MAG: D-alanyl-D-alanine carboxypeptidase [Candidatus Moranbacteria bacterium]|nr:D-alanyl-D-alanine carboxypeptidase [Candidatus Moranbacteria bacterium]